MLRRLFCLAAVVIGLSFTFNVARAQPVVIEATSDPALEQLPILFHHGFNDDGRLWAEGPGGGASDSYFYVMSAGSYQHARPFLLMK